MPPCCVASAPAEGTLQSNSRTAVAHASQPRRSIVLESSMLASLAQTLAMYAIAMFMLSVGLRTDRYVVRDALVRHRGHLIHAAVAVWIAVPLLTLAVLYT